ncbi:hypothetical protein [uncultured Cyclobacterium sp.]|uniref:hypothetical protein n=1 Tax=uncultured Cyclobacterium sp. TaxID=453820 RepID=UPI0030ED6B4D
MLYPDLILSEPEVREILNLIWESVYGKLQSNATEKDWLKYQDTAFNRVNMVARWLNPISTSIPTTSGTASKRPGNGM